MNNSINDDGDYDDELPLNASLSIMVQKLKQSGIYFIRSIFENFCHIQKYFSMDPPQPRFEDTLFKIELLN